LFWSVYTVSIVRRAILASVVCSSSLNNSPRLVSYDNIESSTNLDFSI